MTTLYVDPHHLSATRLGASTPLGLFRGLDDLAAALFWVVERGGAKFAIVLESQRPNYLFQAWPLDDFSNWTGFSLGPVEVQIDPSSGTWQERAGAVPGCISVGAGKVRIAARHEGAIGHTGFELGDTSGQETPHGVAFTRWRLIQRDHCGDPVQLFEAKGSARAADA